MIERDLASSLWKGEFGERNVPIKRRGRTCLAAQWLRFSAPNAGGTGSIPVRDLRSCQMGGGQKEREREEPSSVFSEKCRHNLGKGDTFNLPVE